MNNTFSLRMIHAEGGLAAVKKAAGYSVEVKAQGLMSEYGRTLRLEYDVRGPALHVDPLLPKDDSVWELWNHDVVEVFITPTAPIPYYEFQVSPHGQRLELLIKKPRVEDDRTYRCPGLKVGATILEEKADSSHWTGWFEIPLDRLTNKPMAALHSKWMGGLFAILGKPGEKVYFAAFLDPVAPGKEPEYHNPSRFQELFRI